MACLTRPPARWVRLGPFGRGLDVCCGTGAGLRVLASLCQGPVTGVDFSTGMLTQARRAHPGATWVRTDVRALPFAGAFDLAVGQRPLSGGPVPQQRFGPTDCVPPSTEMLSAGLYELTGLARL